jgi:amino acid transporter
MSQPSANRLAQNALSLPELVFTVLATLAPLTLVAAVAPLHFLKGGAAVPGGYLVAAAVMALFAVGFCTMTRYVRNTGAFYAIITQGLGPVTGAAAAGLAVVAYNALQVSTYGAIGYYAGSTAQRFFGVSLPWWVYAGVALAVVGFLGFRGITASAKVLAVVLVAELAVLVVMVVAVFVSGGPEGFSAEPFEPSTVLSTQNSAMFALIFGAFMGFECTAIYSEEVKGGAATVRRATYVAVGFIGVFYAIVTYAIVTAYGAGAIAGAAEADPAGLVLVVIGDFTAPWLLDVTEVLLLLSAFAALLALHNASNRYAYALGREGLLPRAFGRTQAHTHSPYVAGMAQSVLALVVIVVFAAFGLDPYLGLLLWGSALGFLGIIILWALCSLAVMRYLRRNAADAGIWRTTVAPLMSFLALAVVVVLVFQNFDFLTAGGPLVNTILIVLAAGAMIAGAARAVVLRKCRPAVYRELGSIDADVAG